MSTEQPIGPPADLPPGKVTGVGRYAIGNSNGEFFAVTCRSRHLGADLANGRVDEAGRLVCPWHQSAYDVHTVAWCAVLRASSRRSRVSARRIAC